MRYLINEYGQTLFNVIIGIGIITIFLGSFLTDILDINAKTLEDETSGKLLIEETIPVKIDSFICQDSVIKEGDEYDYTKYIEALNSKKEDISSFVSLYENIDTSLKGEKEAIYILRYNGEKMIGKAKVIIEDENYD